MKTAHVALWLWLSIAAVVLAMVGNLVALDVKSIYASLTPAFYPQALAQDISSLALVSPLWLICAVLALRGSLRAYLVWLGVLAFTVYNYVIYTFSVPFGPLYPLWLAVFGISLYALIGGVASLDHAAVRSAFSSRRAAVVVAVAVMVAAVLFALLWLSEDVPALLAGRLPQSVLDMAVPTNPVHVLDLSFFLPAAFITGALVLRGRPLGYSVLGAFVVFLALTGIPILVTPVVQARIGQAPGWAVWFAIGPLTAIFIGLLAWLLSTVHSAQARR